MLDETPFRIQEPRDRERDRPKCRISDTGPPPCDVRGQISFRFLDEADEAMNQVRLDFSRFLIFDEAIRILAKMQGFNYPALVHFLGVLLNYALAVSLGL